MTSLLRVVAVISALIAIADSAQAAITKFAVIEGISRELVLNETTALKQYADSDSAFYQGSVKDQPQNWARVSRIGSSWQGIVVFDGTIFLINSLADTSLKAKTTTQLSTQAITSLDSLGNCGIENAPIQPKSSTRSLTASSLVTSPVSINYPAYCTEDINGVCLVADLTVVFDSQFQQDFPGTYTSQAASMLNIVDGFYQRELKIVFNRLDIDFSHGGQFTSSRNPKDILEDMNNQRNAGSTSSFDPNVRSIMHLVTGRDFLYNDGTTTNDNVVGLAYSPTYSASNYPSSFQPLLCDGNGTAVSTSQVISYGGSLSPSLTALIMVHEIGHNFGAEHDGDPITASSCTTSGYIMYPQLDPNATHFSTCSIDAIDTNINRLSNVEACFEYPIEASLIAESGNSAQAVANTAGLHNFTLGVTSANGKTGPILVTGAITSIDGAFTAVTLAGNSCTIGGSDKSYSCPLTSAASLNTLAVSFSTGNADLTMTHTASVSGNLYDLDQTNNTVSASVLVSGADLPPSSLTASYLSASDTISLDWQDHATNEDGYEVERSVNNGPWEVIDNSLAANTTHYSDTAITQHAVHTYRVRALFGTTESSPSNEVSVSVNVAQNAISSKKSKKGGGAGLLTLVGLAWLWRRRRHSREPLSQSAGDNRNR